MKFEWRDNPNSGTSSLHLKAGGKRYSAIVKRPRQLIEWVVYRGRAKQDSGLAVWRDCAKGSAESSLLALMKEDGTLENETQEGMPK